MCHRPVLHILIVLSTAVTSPLRGQSVDAEGWTVLDPAAADHVVYVSADGDDASGVVYASDNALLGGDPQLPSGTVSAFRTIASAVADFDEGTAAWVLLRRGDTLYQVTRPLSGVSRERPFVYAAYGSANAAPRHRRSCAPATTRSRSASAARAYATSG